MKSGKNAWGPINLKLRSRRRATKGCWQQGSEARKQGHAAAAAPPPFKGFTQKMKEKLAHLFFTLQTVVACPQPYESLTKAKHQTFFKLSRISDFSSFDRIVKILHNAWHFVRPVGDSLFPLK